MDESVAEDAGIVLVKTDIRLTVRQLPAAIQGQVAGHRDPAHLALAGLHTSLRPEDPTALGGAHREVAASLAIERA